MMIQPGPSPLLKLPIIPSPTTHGPTLDPDALGYSAPKPYQFSPAIQPLLRPSPIQKPSPNHRSQTIAPASVLLTGATGFIGKEILARYLQEETSLYLLIQPHYRAGIERFLAQIQGAESSKANVYLLEGDITKAHLGLSASDWELASSAHQVLHMAAAYDLRLKREVAQRINVNGTRQVLADLKKFRDLKHVGHFSSIAVAGDHNGDFAETDLGVGQSFGDHYAWSKFESEKWVQLAIHRGELPITVFRPGIVVGHSQTGMMERVDGPYYGLRMIANGRHHIFQKAPVPCNTVPVDFVAAAIYAMMHNPAAVGQTVHVTDPEPLTYDEFFNQVIDHWGTFKPWRKPAQFMAYTLNHPAIKNRFNLTPEQINYMLYNKMLAWPLHNISLVKKYLGVPPEAFDYMMYNISYDTTNLKRLVDFDCPRQADYIPILADHYLRRHETIGNKEGRW